MQTEFDGIRLIGDSNFVERTTNAIKILQSTSRYAEVIRPNICTIHYRPIRWLKNFRPNLADAPYFPKNRRLIRVFSPELVDGDPMQYAILLAHESFHHFIFFEYMRFGNWAGFKWHRFFRRHRDELRCKNFEIEIANEIFDDQDSVKLIEVIKYVIPHWDMPRKQVAILDHVRRLVPADRKNYDQNENGSH